MKRLRDLMLAAIAFCLVLLPSCLFVPDSAVSVLDTQKTLFSTSSGETYQWQSVKIGGGGFVTGITIHPTVPNLVYVRTDVGGAFRWDSDNQRWIQLLTAESLPKKVPYNVESIAIASNDPNILYLAAGDYTKNSGVFLKSLDQGNSWEILNLSLPMGGNEPWRWTGERLTIDPNNSDVVYFGSRLDGLWFSEDGGMSWNSINADRVPFGKATSDLDEKAGITYVTFDSTSEVVTGKTQRIYAGVAGEGIYATEDGGETWERLSGGPEAALIPQQGKVTANGELVTTFYREKNDPRGEVWKYTATGWEEITPETGQNYSAIAVDPNDANRMFVIPYPMTPNSIYRSDDGGKSWVTLKTELDKLSWYPDWSFYTLTGGIAISPFDANQVWLTNGIGVWKTNNGNDTQVTWSATVNGIEETVTFDAISLPNEGNLLTAIADFDGFRHDSLSKFPAQNYSKGEFFTTTSLAYSYQSPNFVVSVAGSQNNFQKIRAGFSTDNGRTWQNFASVEEGTHPKELIFGNIAVSATNTNNIIWQPTEGKYLYFSRDRGKTWKSANFLNEVNPKHGPHTHLWNRQQTLAADTIQGETFYLYHYYHGGLFRTDDGGETWNKVNNQLPNGVWNSANVKSSPGMAGEVWVSLNGKGLYRSSNFGEDFFKVENVEQAEVIGFGKAAEGINHPTLYLAGRVDGESGIFRSIDLGKNWLKIANYPHGYQGDFRTLTGDMNVFGRVFLGTGGNGFIYGEPQS
ncbi:MAG: WD40/YVTN/BNR-like repeat-containing protein [Halothece sp.]